MDLFLNLHSMGNSVCSPIGELNTFAVQIHYALDSGLRPGYMCASQFGHVGNALLMVPNKNETAAQWFHSLLMAS